MAQGHGIPTPGRCPSSRVTDEPPEPPGWARNRGCEAPVPRRHEERSSDRTIARTPPAWRHSISAWFSIITALVAGAAGTLSLTSAKSAALVGVFISVTTIPAAGNGALALVFGRFHDAAGSALQLLINLTGIVLAAYLVLLTRGRPRRPEQEPDNVVKGF